MPIGRLLIISGLILLTAGIVFTFAGRLPFRIGRLPGDIYIHGRRSSFYFPLTTCIVLSFVFSVLLWLFRR
jgi:hypothetical protein